MPINSNVLIILKTTNTTTNTSSIDPDPTPTTDSLLREDGVFYILQENGSKILIKSS